MVNFKQMRLLSNKKFYAKNCTSGRILDYIPVFYMSMANGKSKYMLQYDVWSQVRESWMSANRREG